MSYHVGKSQCRRLSSFFLNRKDFLLTRSLIYVHVVIKVSVMRIYLDVVVHSKVTHGLCIRVPHFTVVLQGFGNILSVFVKCIIEH